MADFFAPKHGKRGRSIQRIADRMQAQREDGPWQRARALAQEQQMSLAAEAIGPRIARKAVYLQSTFLGHAATLGGVRAILRSEGRPHLADNLAQHCVEGPREFLVYEEPLQEPPR